MIKALGTSRALWQRLPVLPRLQAHCGRSMSPGVARAGAPVGHLTVEPSQYPQVARGDVVDTLHGTPVPDPYRWLEDPDSPETQAFVAAQNKLTDSVLAQCPARHRFRRFMTALYNYPRFSPPSRHGERYVYSHNTGLQAQAVLYTQAALDAEPVLLLDPNALSADGTVALASWAFSDDGTLLAYALGSGGSDWRTVHVLRVDAASGKPEELPDRLDHVKFSSLAWTHDNWGFFYMRFEAPAAGTDLGTETGANKRQQLWYHAVGTGQEKDAFLFDIPEEPDWMFGAEVTDDGRYMLLSVSSGCEPVNRLYVLDLSALSHEPGGGLDFSPFDKQKEGSQPLPLLRLIDTFEAQYSYVANEGTRFVFHTNLHAPRYRLIQTNLSTHEAGASVEWEDLVPQHPSHLLQWAAALKGDTLVLGWLADVASRLELASLSSGGIRGEIPLPGIGSVGGLSCSRKRTEAFFAFSAFTDPGSVWRFDAAEQNAKPTLHRKTELPSVPGLDFSPQDFDTQQVFVPSKDGTKVPMFIVARKGTPLDGANPTLLYGYGGFNISLEPGFSVSRLCWMLAFGGVYAMANLRGGGEYGVEWRDAGSVRKKQNVFDDFQACAAHLHSAVWTSPGRLAIQGGSNGGLLVAACANQAPDLFGAVIAQVGVMDMLRFHLFTIGHAWVSDYGSPDQEGDFRNLLSYSPLHNVRPPEGGTRQYPAILLTTGDHDDRVVPLHSHKLIAQLQHELAGTPDSPQRNPLLTRIEVRAGHGAGKPTAKIIEEAADSYAFAAAVLGADWKGPDLPAEG